MLLPFFLHHSAIIFTEDKLSSVHLQLNYSCNIGSYRNIYGQKTDMHP